MGLFGKKKKSGGVEEVAEAVARASGEAQEEDGVAETPRGERRKNWWQRLREGLSKTVGSFFGGIRAVVLGRRVDEDLIEQVWEQMIAADMGPDLADEVTARLRTAWKKGEVTEGEQVIPFLKQQFIEVLSAKGNEVTLAATPPTVILVVGVNGTGKTTSIGKLAWHYQQQGKKVMIAACDTFRAAAESQLEIWATQRVGCAFHKGEPKSDPASVAFTAAQRAKEEGVEILIVDTAGRLHTDRNLMEQLAKIKRSLGKNVDGAPHETLLVVDANYGLNVIQQTEKFLASADVTGLFLAKLDATGKGGVVLNIHQRFDVPVKFVGTGEQREDFAAFDATQFVEALFAEE